jgi:hypothetical protein
MEVRCTRMEATGEPRCRIFPDVIPHGMTKTWNEINPPAIMP